MEGINEKRINEVEKALGIKLYACQRDFIFNGYQGCHNERCTGQTTAYCIKLLLTDGEPIKLWDPEQMKRLSDGNRFGSRYNEWFRRFLIENYERLKAAGVETRVVEFKRVKDGEYSRQDSHIYGRRFLY